MVNDDGSLIARIAHPAPVAVPFHPVFGIQTSNLIFESAVGLISAATRQKGDNFVRGGPDASIDPGL